MNKIISNGSQGREFNYLQAKGYARPLSVLQIRSNIHNKYSRISLHRMLDKITPIEIMHIIIIMTLYCNVDTLTHESITTKSNDHIVLQGVFSDISTYITGEDFVVRVF